MARLPYGVGVDDIEATRLINSSNTQRGADFEQLVRDVLASELALELAPSLAVPIGDPPKPHRFDLGSVEQQVVVECKNHTWTKTNNIPSAKITTLREAVFYLRLAPAGYRRILAMKRHTHPDREESLAEYFVRLNQHLLGDVEVIEATEDGTLRRLTTSARAGSVAFLNGGTTP